MRPRVGLRAFPGGRREWQAPAQVPEGVRDTGDDVNGRPHFSEFSIAARALPSSGHLPGSLWEGGAVG
eukprot:12593122-Alexandrium_andersonii.AAC.1